MPLQMLITDAGLDALVAAEASATEVITITEIGLSSVPFVMAPTLTALPGEFKVLNTLSGQEVAPNMIHLTAYDTSNQVYSVTGFGLYLDDGTLFAVYSAAVNPVLTKADLAFALFALDVAFTNNAAANIEFGNNIFLYPPATPTVQGVARFATQPEVDAVVDGPDDHRVTVTAKTLRARLATIIASLVSLAGITITGAGAAQGGGNLTANRVITVEQAAEGDLEGSSALKVLTPSILGLVRLFAVNGRFRLFGFEVKWGSFSIGANTQLAVTFPVAFANGQCFAVMAQGSAQDAADQDNYVHAIAGSQSGSGFTAHNGHGAQSGNYIAIGN